MVRGMNLFSLSVVDFPFNRRSDTYVRDLKIVHGWGSLTSILSHVFSRVRETRDHPLSSLVPDVSLYVVTGSTTSSLSCGWGVPLPFTTSLSG